MEQKFAMVQLEHGTHKTDLSFLSRPVEEKVKAYHQSFPVYQETPLARLKETARELGVGEIYVKDESYRFGLNAFKVLGGSYAMGHYLADRLGKPMEEVDYRFLTSETSRKALGDITFVTATDGNHGRGVAWTARQLRQKSVVYMPEGSAQERLDNIRAEGADASITNLNYDDAVRLANRQAEEKGWVMVQDTAWEGMNPSPVGSCRAMELWDWKPMDSCRKSLPIFSSRQESVLWLEPLPDCFLLCMERKNP